jgi:hypothetical protein
MRSHLQLENPTNSQNFAAAHLLQESSCATTSIALASETMDASNSRLPAQGPKNNQFVHEEERAKDGLVVSGQPEREIDIKVVRALAGEAGSHVG